MIVVQVTDTHITSPGDLVSGGVDTAAALKRCVAHVMALDPAPDAVVISGDLVNNGRSEEYNHLRELLSPLRVPLYLLPGNHDDRDVLRKAFTDHDYLPRDGLLNYVIEDFALRIVAVDTVVAGAEHGDVAESALRWLDDRLGEDGDRPTLICLHHPPFLTGIERMDESRCRNGERLAEVLGRHRQVLRIACGHIHRSVQTCWHRIPVSVAPSPSHAVELVLRPQTRPGIVLEHGACHVHLWRPDPDPFGSMVTHISYI
ncbi:MAG: phosphodiesterase [Rhodospirillales bacterium]|nr:phosphodiesterase [Rhodospirillales bacterium]